MARDMTRAQFDAALKRNGFAPRIHFGSWIYSADDDRHGYGVTVDAKGKIMFRATLAHIIQRREEARAKRSPAPAEA
jgi:hypothetical protein